MSGFCLTGHRHGSAGFLLSLGKLFLQYAYAFEVSVELWACLSLSFLSSPIQLACETNFFGFCNIQLSLKSLLLSCGPSFVSSLLSLSLQAFLMLMGEAKFLKLQASVIIANDNLIRYI